MRFRVVVADSLRPEIAKLPEAVSWRLAHRLHELAELAEVHPVSHLPLSLRCELDGSWVTYEVDPTRRLLTLTGMGDGERGPASPPLGRVAGRTGRP